MPALYKCSQFNLSLLWPFICPLHKVHLRCISEELKGTKCEMFGEHPQQTRPDWLWANTASPAMGTGLRPGGGGGGGGGQNRRSVTLATAPPSSAEVKSWVALYLSLPLHLRDQNTSSPDFLLNFNICFLLFYPSVSVWSLCCGAVWIFGPRRVVCLLLVQCVRLM